MQTIFAYFGLIAAFAISVFGIQIGLHFGILKN
jgi:hypothetical protein